MEATNQRFAYRCLPLNIANAYGWEVLCNAGFLAMWTGGSGIDAIAMEPEPGTVAPAVSHFGHGILTFHLPCLFRTVRQMAEALLSGLAPDGAPTAAEAHRTRLRLKPFKTGRR